MAGQRALHTAVNATPSGRHREGAGEKTVGIERLRGDEDREDGRSSWSIYPTQCGRWGEWMGGEVGEWIHSV